MNTQRMPGIARVAAAQFKLMTHNKYALAILALPLLYFMWPARMPEPFVILPWQMPPRFDLALILLGVVAVVAPALVWSSEGPSRRRYHWSMPVSRELHDTLRIGAGAVWLMLSVAVFAAIGTINEPAVLREQWLFHAPAFYAGLFLVSLLLYLLCTVFALLFDRPLLGIILTTIALIAVQTQFMRVHAPAVRQLADTMFSSERSLSLGTALTGSESSAPWHNGAEIRRVYNATYQPTLRLVQATGMRTEELLNTRWMLNSTYRALTVSEWLKALALWYGVALCALVLALWRRPNV